MAKHAPDLFKNRSATQEFLFSHSDDTIDEGKAASPVDGLDRAAPQPSVCFSGMPDRQGLAQAIDVHMASAATLCAIAVAVDQAAGTPTADEKKREITDDAVTPLVMHCRSHAGTWARIGRNRFACVFAHLSAAEGQMLAEDLLKAFPETESPLITIGLAVYPTINYTRRQIVDNAEKALEHGMFFGPGSITRFDAVSLNISGDRHYQAGDIAGAVDEFKRGLLLDPTDTNLHNSLGVCYGVLKDYDNALAAFDSANWLAPDEMMAIYNKGYVLLLKGNREQALECFLEADAREPDVFEVVFHIGQIYMDMDAADRARPYLEAAARANSRSGPVFKSLGACLDKLGLIKEAIQAYKSAVKINPDDAESLSLLGLLYTRRGESLDVASVLCEQSVRLDPRNGIFRHRLGTVYLNRGQLEDALSAFESAVALGHDSQAQIAVIQNRRMAANAS